MRSILAAAAAAALFAGSSALAVNSCTVSASAAVFGAYIPGSGPAYAAATIKVACTSGAFFGVGLGTGSSGSQLQRLLIDGTYSLEYNLYTTAAYSGIWGDGTGGTQIVTGSGLGPATPLSFTAYGLIPDNAFNQNAVPGAYSDTIIVVVSY